MFEARGSIESNLDFKLIQRHSLHSQRSHEHRHSLMHDNSRSLIHSHRESLLQESEPRSTKTQALHIVKNAIPNTLSNLCFYISSTICFSIISAHSSNNTELLAACGIGSSIIVSAYYSVFYSLNTAVLNLGSQAIGSGNYELMGYTLHRALIINFLLMIPLAFLISQGESFLLMTGLSPEVSRLAIKYAIDMLPATSLTVIFNTLHYYLIAQETLYPQVISLSVSVTTQYFLCQLMIASGVDFYKAVVLSKLAAEVLNLTCIVIYISRQDSLARSWFRPHRKSFRRVLSQLITGLEGGSITYFEVLIFEIITFFTGVMENSQVAAQAAFLNFAYISDAAPVGIGGTLAALVSEKLGEGSKKETIGYIRTGISIILVLTVIGILGVFNFSDSIVRLYTQDPEVVPVLTTLLLYYPIFQLFDYPLQVTSGLLRSLGLERFALLSYFIVYYFIALPVSYLLGVKYQMGTLGLWTGIGLGTAILSLLGLFMILYGANIDQQMAFIRLRLKHFDDQRTTMYAPSVFIEMKDLKSGEF